MNPFTLLAEAVHSLGKNKVRTSLSMLGIVIGVGAVITLVSMAEATRIRVEDEIARMGDDWMWIWYWGHSRGGVRRGDVGRKAGQTKGDADAIMEHCSAGMSRKKSAETSSKGGTSRASSAFRQISSMEPVSRRALSCSTKKTPPVVKASL